MKMKWRKWTGLIVVFALLLCSMPLVTFADNEGEGIQQVISDEDEETGENNSEEESIPSDEEANTGSKAEDDVGEKEESDREDDADEDSGKEDDSSTTDNVEDGSSLVDNKAPSNTEDNTAAENNKKSILDNILPAVRFEAEDIAVQVNQNDFDLLAGVAAADEDNQPVAVFLLDDGGFDIAQPQSYIVTYGAEHPVSGEVFRKERTVAVVQFLYDPQPESAEAVQALVDQMEPGLEGLLALPKWEFAIDQDWLPVGWAQSLFTDEESGAEYWRLTMGIMALAGTQVTAGTAQDLQDALNSRTDSDFTVLLTDDLYLSDLSLKKYINIAEDGNAGTGATITLKAAGASPVTIYGNGTEGIVHFQFSTYSSETALTGYTLIFDNVIVDGTGTGGGISLPANATDIVVEGAVIQNCSQGLGGAVRVFGGASATFKDCIITDNASTLDGGAFYIVNGADVTIIDCAINDNTTGGDGGAIYAGGSALKIQESIIRGNSAGGNGGAISFTDSSDDLELIDFCRISNNNAGGNGGGIYLKNATSLQMNGDSDMSRKAPDDPKDPAGPIIEYNEAKGNGGGIYFDTGSYTSPATEIYANRRTLVRYNKADGNGAGIWANGSNLTMDNDCHLFGNIAGGNGGGLWMGNSTGGEREIEIYGNTRVLSNTAKNGGGIFAEPKEDTSNIRIRVYQSWVNTNQATEDGGAIYLKNNGNAWCFLIFEESTALYDTANNGGAFYLSTKSDWTQVRLTKATLAANLAHKNGGAIYAEAMDANQPDPDLDLFIENSVIGTARNETNHLMSANSAYGDGGALYLVADSGNLKAVINNTRLGAEIGSTAQTGNRAAGNGAAIAVIAEGNADTEVLISDSNFTGNDANKNGGAIYANSPASSSFKIEVDNTPFHENKVREGWGGAVWLDCPAGNVLLKNLKMSGNLSPGLGGAIYTDAYAVLGLENITFLDNQAAFGTTELTSEMLAIHSNKVSGATTFTSPYSNAYNNHDVSNPRVRVIFVDEKGLISEADRIVHFNDKITRPDTGNVNTGTLSLTGWYTAPDGSTTWDFDADRISGNLTLYAGWSQSGGGNGGNNGGGNNTGDGGDNSGDGGSGGSSGGGSGGTSTPDDLDKGSEGGFNPGNPGSGNSDNPKISFGSGGGSSERDFYINDEDVPMAAALLALIEDEGVPLALGTLPKTGKTASTVFAGMLCIAALITSIAIAPRRNKA